MYCVNVNLVHWAIPWCPTSPSQSSVHTPCSEFSWGVLWSCSTGRSGLVFGRSSESWTAWTCTESGVYGVRYLYLSFTWWFEAIRSLSSSQTSPTHTLHSWHATGRWSQAPPSFCLTSSSPCISIQLYSDWSLGSLRNFLRGTNVLKDIFLR